MATPLTHSEIKQQVIKLAGGRKALAEALEITPQAISQWDKIPLARVRDVMNATEQRMTPQEIRPDIFGDLPTQAA